MQFSAKKESQQRAFSKQLENIKLEGTYTGKALAALISDAEKLKDKTVLFWNTFCGLDFSAQTSNTSYKQLPVYFQYYFEKDVQELTQS